MLPGIITRIRNSEEFVRIFPLLAAEKKEPEGGETSRKRKRCCSKKSRELVIYTEAIPLRQMAVVSESEGRVSSRNVSSDGTNNGNSSGSKSSSVPPTPRSEGEILQSSNLKSFSYSDLRMATRNFRPDSVLGEGGFGSVFKGWMDEQTYIASKPGTGVVVAVKRLNLESFQGHREWLAEVNYLGQFSHPNLVNLIGYCLEDEHRLLVYEFMPRGSLENHLFRRGSYFQPLSWSLRLKVALGAAKGLAFLHSAETKVIYRDFKTSNVLLDTDYNAKLSDFGLAKDGPIGDKSHVSTRVMGTYGYAAPEYLATDGAHTAANLALQCISMNPRSRPSMADVVKELELLQDPKGLTRMRRHSNNEAQTRRLVSQKSDGTGGGTGRSATYPRPSASVV
ncbi:hypothetical protein E3N88_22182 [Mikania micrantha]|uniref:non-specific serine/threonine protein kinase n=1 Tax=Mikania micrantha TaxID=192012 RepID=A0A5N6N9S2_9ASTR|nr:hypothetical protein E3N88_22182 [Mikania micrantha]